MSCVTPSLFLEFAHHLKNNRLKHVIRNLQTPTSHEFFVLHLLHIHPSLGASLRSSLRSLVLKSRASSSGQLRWVTTDFTKHDSTTGSLYLRQLNV